MYPWHILTKFTWQPHYRFRGRVRATLFDAAASFGRQTIQDHGKVSPPLFFVVRFWIGDSARTCGPEAANVILSFLTKAFLVTGASNRDTSERAFLQAPSRPGCRQVQRAWIQEYYCAHWAVTTQKFSNGVKSTTETRSHLVTTCDVRPGVCIKDYNSFAQTTEHCFWYKHYRKQEGALERGSA